MRFQGGDTVVSCDNPTGPRGMVLGYDDDNNVMVCWEVGYQEIYFEFEESLQLVDVLDLMVEAFDGKETKFRYGWPAR